MKKFISLRAADYTIPAIGWEGFAEEFYAKVLAVIEEPGGDLIDIEFVHDEKEGKNAKDNHEAFMLAIKNLTTKKKENN